MAFLTEGLRVSQQTIRVMHVRDLHEYTVSALEKPTSSGILVTNDSISERRHKHTHRLFLLFAQ